MQHPYNIAFMRFIHQGDLTSFFTEKGINFMDRIAVVCRFDEREKLRNIFDKYINDGQEKGKLEIVALMGLGSTSMKMLQKYVNCTSDIQTAALIACYYRVIGRKDDEKLKRFVEIYREHLNRLKLFNIRADFDITRGKMSKSDININKSKKQTSLQEINVY